jgi:uncharacterized Fe-S cluster protein YjdI
MEEDLHEYGGKVIEVNYDHNRCIHVRECVEGLPGVFDPSQRPWIDADDADADEIARVIERCPTGALHYDRTDDGAPESVPSRNTVTATANGPLYLHGDIVIRSNEDVDVTEFVSTAMRGTGQIIVDQTISGDQLETLTA